jgi:YbbR domain-containing protein
MSADRTRDSQKLFLKHIVRKIFLEDWAMKLLALAITFGLWFGVTGLSTPTTKRFTVPLNPNISNNAEITSAIITEVDIIVSGDKRRVDQINRSDLSATLDLTDVQPGERVVSLSPDNVSVSLPQGVKLAEVQPSRIAVKLEAVEEKDVDVQANVQGTPARGFEVYSTTVVPPRVRVRGPQSVIETLDHVDTDKIDISGREEDLPARQVPVSVVSPKAAVLNTVVDVFLRIGETRIERSFRTAVSNDNKEVSFVVFGPRSIVQKMKAEDFKVEMVLGSSGEEEPEINLPPQLREVAEVRSVRVVTRLAKQ